MAGPVSQSNLSIPPTPDSITPEWLTVAFRGSGTVENASVVSIGVKPVAAGSGFVGQAARLHIEYDRIEPGAPATVFAKLSSADPAVREKLRTVGLYETEAGFYQDLAAMKSLPLRVPRPYVSLYDHASAMSILLIEDLGDARFGDNITGLSPSDARIAVRQLAHLHAHFWEAPALQTFSWLRSLADDAAARIALYRAMLPRFEQNCAEFSAPSLFEAARTYADVLPACIDQHCTGPQTLIHGDFRADNFAFTSGSENGGFILFDWQVVRRSRGARDLAYFLAGSLSTEQRRETGRSLVELYHETLLAHGVKDYSSQDLARDLRRGLGAPLSTAVIALGLLDFSSERGAGLARRVNQRLGAVLEDHQFAEHLEDLGSAGRKSRG
jgi:Ecdysteroid kinase-like family